MPLQHAVLALLADGPSHGYDLRGKFEDAVGPQWGLNVGHLYQVLDRLHRDGLVEATAVPQPHRPDRVMYRVTSAGQVELNTWLAEPITRSRGYRDDFFLKLMAAAQRGPAEPEKVIRTQRKQLIHELHSLTESHRATGEDPLVSLLLDSAILQTQARLQLIDLAEDRSEQLLTRATRTQRAPQTSAGQARAING